jgi:hypothetical protein
MSFHFFLLTTPIFLALPMLFCLPLIILLPNWPLWGWSFNLANVWFGPYLAYLIGSPFQLVVITVLIGL